jgi:phosphoribosylanthranilate isomerase
MVKVKICGITNLNDAITAVDSGADALGFIFASSPRSISPENARDIIRNIPPFVKSVGVFVDEDSRMIKETMERCGIDLIQLHGDESPEQCNEFMPRAIKAIKMRDASILKSITSYYGNVRALLLDTYSMGKTGGTGESFDWNLAIEAKGGGIPIILAGGLGPSNIENAVSSVRPYAVDVNSGIEESPGHKSHALMKELFERIRLIREESSLMR